MPIASSVSCVGTPAMTIVHDHPQFVLTVSRLHGCLMQGQGAQGHAHVACAVLLTLSHLAPRDHAVPQSGLDLILTLGVGGLGAAPAGGNGGNSKAAWGDTIIFTAGGGAAAVASTTAGASLGGAGGTGTPGDTTGSVRINCNSGGKGGNGEHHPRQLP
jgi:hypothetical protein